MSQADGMVVRPIWVLLGASFLVLATSAPSVAASVTGCEGDCGGDDAVTVNELVFSPGCAAEVVTAFLDDPTRLPDTSCAEALPPLAFL